MLNEDSDCKLTLSQQGMHDIAKDVSPFVKIYEKGKTIRDSNYLHLPLRAWATENVETLSLKKMTKKTNEILE